MARHEAMKRRRRQRKRHPRCAALWESSSTPRCKQHGNIICQVGHSSWQCAAACRFLLSDCNTATGVATVTFRCHHLRHDSPAFWKGSLASGAWRANEAPDQMMCRLQNCSHCPPHLTAQSTAQHAILTAETQGMCVKYILAHFADVLLQFLVYCLQECTLAPMWCFTFTVVIAAVAIQSMCCMLTTDPDADYVLTDPLVQVSSCYMELQVYTKLAAGFARLIEYACPCYACSVM